jgi:carboxyl-terminal processing protease
VFSLQKEFRNSRRKEQIISILGFTTTKGTIKLFMDRFKYWLTGIVILSIIGLQACKDDDIPLSGDAAVNKWIYENMTFWYYWNTRIPAKTNQNLGPEDFFNSLLVKDEDRFSAIYEDYEETLSALEGVSKEAGYEYTLYRETETGSTVIAQVLYIKPGSPAASTVLKRGDIISHINGQQITLTNYRSLIQQTGENHTITYKPITVTGVSTGFLGDPVTLSLSAVTFNENPNFFHTTFDIDGKKAGYFVYNFFASGIGDGTQYNDEMDQIMADFKAQGITDLIVDLRYNGGGYVEASINLASLIGKNIDESKIFTKREYNSKVVDNFKLRDSDLIQRFKFKSQNVGNTLPGNLYVLTGSQTASASELVINALRPFMNVTLIGEQTVGKNVGSIPLYEENNPKNRWLILPIVVKSFNSNNQSDYGNGFVPNFMIDEGIYLYPLGDREEPLLSFALAQLSSASGRSGLPQTKNIFAKKLGTSIEFKNNGIRTILLEKALEQE